MNRRLLSMVVLPSLMVLLCVCGVLDGMKRVKKSENIHEDWDMEDDTVGKEDDTMRRIPMPPSTVMPPEAVRTLRTDEEIGSEEDNKGKKDGQEERL